MMTTNPRQFATKPSPTLRQTRRVYVSMTHGEPLRTDWANSPSLAQFDTSCALDDGIHMLCYAEHRRAPTLADYDHDGQGF